MCHFFYASDLGAHASVTRAHQANTHAHTLTSFLLLRLTTQKNNEKKTPHMTVVSCQPNILPVCRLTVTVLHGWTRAATNKYFYFGLKMSEKKLKMLNHNFLNPFIFSDQPSETRRYSLYCYSILNKCIYVEIFFSNPF